MAWRNMTPFDAHAHLSATREPVTIGFINILPDVTSCFVNNVDKGTEVGLKLCKKPGLSVEIAMAVCFLLKIVCQIKITPHESFGNTVTNTSVNLLSDVVRGKYDVGFPQFTPSTVRLKHVDFSITVRIGNPLWITRFADRRGFNIDRIYVFDSATLGLIAAAVLLLGIVAAVARHWFPQGPKDRGRNLIVKLNGIIEALSVFLGKNTGDRYNRAIEIMFALWGICSFVFVTFYSSVILVNLLAVSFDIPFSDLATLADCVESKKCGILFLGDSSGARSKVEDASKESDYHYWRIKQALEYNPAVSETGAKDRSGAILDRAPRFIVYESQIARYAPMLKAVRKCSLMAVPHITQLRDVFIFQKGSPLKDLFDQGIVHLHAYGIVERLDLRYVGNPLQEQRNCFQQKSELTSMSMGIGAYVGAGVPIACGIGIAFLALFWELVHKNIISSPTIEGPNK